MAIFNAGISAKLKVRTFTALIGKLKVKCLKIPHYVLPRPL
jgi:hypothetical protein